MTRQDTEAKIMHHLKEIVKAYHQYNPHGKYLMLTFHRNCLSIHNEHWDADSKLPINGFEVLDGSGKGVIQL